MIKREVTNVVLLGLGGQGVIRASDIIADVMFHNGFDVKKAEVHGMSQRGGVVKSDVRFGKRVLSPMVPKKQADYVILIDSSAEQRTEPFLSDKSRLISPADIDLKALPHLRCLNVALLGVMSLSLPIDVESWRMSIQRNFRPDLRDINLMSFSIGRRTRRVA